MQKEINKIESPLIAISEVAKILNIQPNSIRVWLSKDVVIPKHLIVRLGRRVLFNREKLYRWIDEGCKYDIANKKVAIDKSP